MIEREWFLESVDAARKRCVRHMGQQPNVKLFLRDPLERRVVSKPNRRRYEATVP